MKFQFLMTIGLLIGIHALALQSSFYPPRDDGRDQLFNDGWLFHRGDLKDGEKVALNDSNWSQVDLPHDWSVDPIPADELKMPDAISPITGTWLYTDGDNDDFAKPTFNTANWKSIQLPVIMKDFKPQSYRWFRRDIELTEEAANKGITLKLGQIDDCDELYVNGQKIGDTGVMPKNQPQGNSISAKTRERNYRVPASVLKPGQNLIALCVYNEEGEGGFISNFTKNHHENDVGFQSAGPFVSTAIGGTHSGYTVGGIGWYRKHFDWKKEDGHTTIRFGAVMMRSDVWINGQHLGFWPYGYTSFYYDLTPYLNVGENVIAVRVNNEGITSRWYPGSGIYRNVWLTQTAPTHVRPWGIWARTLSANEKSAELEVDVELNGSIEDVEIELIILDNNGKQITQKSVPAESEKTTLTLSVENPKLWDLENPYLHIARAVILQNGKQIDQFDQMFGIRTISFTPDNGFQLNGKMINMLGGCVHHDNGLIGARAPARSEFRKMEIMKQEGYNAVRAAHNPMSSSFYEACDRIGLLVMDEIFDVWNIHKTPHDYAEEEWQKGRAKDMENWLRRTRNHPSIVIRSLGNEIGNLRNNNIEAVIKDLKDLMELAKPFDDTRPYTGGSAMISDKTNYMKLYDVAGYNYREDIALKNQQQFPEWTAIGTESSPEIESQFRTWLFVQEHSWFTGCFVWSAFEYIGESWSGWVGLKGESVGWPSYAAGCGMMDITGLPKGGQVYRRVMAKASPIEINVLEPLPEGSEYMRKGWSWANEYPYWGWNGFEGKPMSIKVMTYAPEVRLTLNGKEINTVKRDPTKLHVDFTVNYEAGALVAEGIENGKVISSTKLETPGKPVGLRIISDRNSITGHNNDRAYVSVEVIDAQGRLVMQNRHRIHIEVSGAGEIEGCGSGFHKDIYSFGNPDRIDTWRGRAMAIIKPIEKSGKIEVSATSEALENAKISINVE